MEVHGMVDISKIRAVRRLFRNAPQKPSRGSATAGKPLPVRVRPWENISDIATTNVAFAYR